MMKKGEVQLKIIVFLAEGFEEVEAITVIDYLRRVGVDVDTVSITEQNEVEGAHSIKVIADLLIDDIKQEDYDGLVIPGGMPGATNLRDEKKVIDIVKKMNGGNKLIAAICAGPIVLEKAGVISGKKVTSYPGFDKELLSANYTEEKVIKDGNIITSRGPALAVDFAIEIVGYLLCDKRAEALKKDILYKI